MANVKSLKKTLESCFDEDWIRENAFDVGLVKRRKKVDIVAFFWTLVLGFGTGSCRSIAELRRNFGSATGSRLVASSFYDRFTPALCKFLKRAVGRACQTLADPHTKLQGKLSSFADLVVADATVISLHNFLESHYQACRTNHTKSALKLQLVMSVLAASPRKVQIFSQRVHEVKKMTVGPWVRGRLLLMDLGYYSFSLFERIQRNSGFFISRVKKNADFEIAESHLACRGRAMTLEGKSLQEVLPKLKRRTIDLDVWITVKRRPHNGWQTTVTKKFRLVGLRNETTGKYHLYITNVPRERLSSDDVARVYAARWEVELLFKELKSGYRLDEMPSSKRHIVEALIYAAILALTVSRVLLFALRRSQRLSKRRTPERRWAAVLKTCVHQLLSLLVDPRPLHGRWRQLGAYIAHEFVDPNRNRTLNLRGLGA